MRKRSQQRIRKQSRTAKGNNREKATHKARVKKTTNRISRHNGHKRAVTHLLPFTQAICGDARHIPLAANSIDLVLTSPAYWRKRDYQHPNQIGQERTAQQYIASLVQVLREC